VAFSVIVKFHKYVQLADYAYTNQNIYFLVDEEELMEKARNLEERAAIEENDRDDAREDEDAEEDNGKADQI
jgi:hypothetical protein